MTPTTPDWIVLAHLLRPQGRKGEVLAELFTDFPERFEKQTRVFLAASGFAGTEAEARAAKKGTWAATNVIKNAESADDILAGIGRFMLVEGRVLSVRQAGTMTYLNFGRNWTRDFAATISRRMMPGVESSGLTLKSLENRRIRVRGWVEAHPGPRIEVVRAGQIEVLSGN